MAGSTPSNANANANAVGAGSISSFKFFNSPATDLDELMDPAAFLGVDSATGKRLITMDTIKFHTVVFARDVLIHLPYRYACGFFRNLQNMHKRKRQTTDDVEDNGENADSTSTSTYFP